MFTKKTYNVAIPNGKGRYNSERVEVHNLPSKRGVRNVGFTYATTKEAMLARVAVAKYIEKTKLNLKAYQRGNMLIVNKP